MNYYPFHLGDYATHTAHLEPMEDLAYRRMLDLYYRTESPLPQDPTEVARLIRLRDHAAAVRDVLTEFFDATPDGWRHKRCDSEIAKYKAMADGGRKGAAVRWGRAGDAPPIGLAMAPLITPQCQPEPEPRTKNQNQEPKPRTKNHQHPGGAPPDPQAPTALSGRVPQKRGPKPAAPSSEAWEAYTDAYQNRYGVPPVRNASVNAHLAQFVGRLGAGEAPAVAAHFVGSQNGLYVAAMHPTNLLLRDAEKLRTEWATGRGVTRTQAMMADKTQTNFNSFAPLIAAAEAREAAERKSHE